MAHDSRNSNVLWYIDSITPDGDEYNIKGWITHKTLKVTGLKIDGQDIKVNVHDRFDVLGVYPTLPTTQVGVEFKLRKEDFNKLIDVVTERGIVREIGSIYPWYIYHLGFNNKNKNLIVVDNFYNNPDEVREYAMKNLTFNFSGYHRGQRSTDQFILSGTKEAFESILGRPIYNWNHPNYANGVFQFCTAQDPIVYHVDTQNYAAMVYLTPDAPLRSGTASFKSKLTGATRFDTNDHPLFEPTFKGKNSDLNFYDNSTFEMVDSVANVYNRLVMFDAKSIHAATGYFGDAIENSRFFHLFFFDI